MYCSQSVTLFQKEDVTWPDQKGCFTASEELLHLPNVYAYADDTQLYLAFKPGDYANETAAVSSIQSCIRDVQNWIMMDRLKRNLDKTEFLILRTRQQIEKVITSHLVVGECRISPSTKVKNLTC